MKSTLFITLVYLSTYVAAFGDRGAAERVEAFYLYVLEWENLPAASHTVAVGCDVHAGHPGTRCALHEFVDYLWADNPDNPGLPRPPSPTAADIPEPANLATSNPVALRTDMLRFQGGAYCKFTDPERFVRGSGTDYYAAIENSADSFVALKNYFQNGAISTRAKALMDRGKLAFQITRELRRSDADKVLLASMKTFLRNIPDRNGNPLNGAPEFRVQTSPVTGVSAWKRFDLPGTFGKYGALVANLDPQLEAEITRLHNTDAGISHARAIDSSNISMWGVQCAWP